MKAHQRLLIAALLFIALLTGALLAVVHLQSPSGTSGHPERGGSLRVGFAVEAPYAFLDAHGQVTGEAPEIFRRMAHRIGVTRIDWVKLDFAQLLPELQLGRIDAIAAGMFVTPERQKEALFTQPTARVRSALIVRPDEQRLPGQPTTADLPRAPGFRWATLHGAEENGLLARAGVPASDISTVPQASRGLRTVAEQTSDGFVISAVTATRLVAANPQWQLEVRPVQDAPAGYPAFAFRLTDTGLRDAMNEELKSFLGTPEHLELVAPFGFTVSELNSPLP